MGITVISTKYKGYNFRSRLEARWAVYFDSLGIRWEYEKEGFHLTNKFNSYNYLPDFWFPDLKMWAEVKAEIFSDEEFEKARLLAIETKFDVLMLIGIPERKYYGAINSYGDAWQFYALSNYHDYPSNEYRFYFANPEELDIRFDPRFNDIDEHVNRAKSARFEYMGEKYD